MLATPAQRLIGHWTSSLGDHLYFAKIEADGLGSYILVQPSGNTTRHQYRIISQIPEEETLEIQLVFSDGDTRRASYRLSQDGKNLTSSTMIMGTKITTHLQYADDGVEPVSSERKVTLKM